MPASIAIRQPPSFRDKESELGMRIKEPFNVVAVGDLIQMMPFSNRDDANIQALVQLMQQSDVTFANNENTVVDRLTFRGPVSHMEADKHVVDDWKNMGIDMVTKANNHTFDCGDAGLIQNFEQLRRVGIEYVGTDYSTVEARLARFKTTPKGIVGFIGAYAETEDFSQLFGIPTKDPIVVTSEQLDELRAMRDSIVARRAEVRMPIGIPKEDPEGSVLVFGRQFRVRDAGAEADSEVAGIKKRLEHHLESKGQIKYKNNSVRLKVYHSVTTKQMLQLRSIAGIDANDDAQTLDAFGVHFKVGLKPGEYSYVMEPQDFHDILREVRSGKQFSDFLSVTIHWHQNRFSFQHYSFDHYPADYQINFAREVIDNGADFFFGHGVHTLKGVEIYKGKPIFYGVSNFVFQHSQFRSWRDDAAGRAPAPLEGHIVGDGEVNEARWAWLDEPENREALLVSVNYFGGKLSRVLVYPADLGRTPRHGSMIGTPTRPTLEVANEILGRLCEYSQPFGTKITVENGVGVIHIPPQ
ncbi:capsule synthesis [Trichoderma arundinaceum]|uniref:Capsule synthesis n=1 Tax=Trichoderma arundinaceum TaxID=490622 RepID=A0A395NX43_TRIAR|nr:capsule synthesis [Trichoderma arundinaceum]